MTNLWYLYGHQSQDQLKVKAISRLKLFQGQYIYLRSRSMLSQIVSVSSSTSEQAVRVRLKDILVLCIFDSYISFVVLHN